MVQRWIPGLLALEIARTTGEAQSQPRASGASRKTCSRYASRSPQVRGKRQRGAARPSQCYFPADSLKHTSCIAGIDRMSASMACNSRFGRQKVALEALPQLADRTGNAANFENRTRRLIARAGMIGFMSRIPSMPGASANCCLAGSSVFP